MANVSEALFDLEPEIVIYKRLIRSADLDGVIPADTEAVEIRTEARVIPTSLKDKNLLELSTTVKTVFSFYLFGSFNFSIDDLIEYRGINYKVFQGWDRDLNGGYTKIIAGIEGQTGYNQDIT